MRLERDGIDRIDGMHGTNRMDGAGLPSRSIWRLERDREVEKPPPNALVSVEMRLDADRCV